MRVLLGGKNGHTHLQVELGRARNQRGVERRRGDLDRRREIDRRRRWCERAPPMSDA
jgi:hypothetical protein